MRHEDCPGGWACRCPTTLVDSAEALAEWLPYEVDLGSMGSLRLHEVAVLARAAAPRRHCEHIKESLVTSFKMAVATMFAAMFVSGTMRAQGNFFRKWEDRVRSTTARQPAWPVPVVSPTAVIVQLARVDFVRQYTSTHTTTWNYDNGKGVNFIPFARTEFDINLPPYIQHNTPKVQDGAGDVSFVAKYRMFAANEGGNYSTAAQIAFSVPTGSYKNGAAVSTVTPTVIGGKGFGKFDVQSALGAALPTSSAATLGRTILWNTVAQYKVGKYLWPELEVNSSYFLGGANDGRNQTFLTPGLMVSRIKLRDDPKNRLALIFGGGMQIATSSFHSYNHALVLTGRMTF